MLVARSDVQAADAQIEQAKSAHQQALEELQTKEELNRRNADIVARREIERLQNVVNGRQAAIDAATAAKQALEAKLSTLLPAQKASAEAALAEAQVDLDKTIIRAGVTGRVEQFALQVGDIVNPVLRPAGILIPDGAGRRALVAGFGQIEAQVLRVGLVAEVTCGSKPWRIIPMVVVQVQDYIAAGQFRGGEQLLEAQTVARPGTILDLSRTSLRRGARGRDTQEFVVAGVGVCNATTARCHALEPLFVKGLETRDRSGARPDSTTSSCSPHADTTCSDVVLHLATTIGMIVQGLDTQATSPRPAHPQNLCFDLSEAGHEGTPIGTGSGSEDAGGTQNWIDDIADL